MPSSENQKIVAVLRELNEFVHDGMEGYERAAQESKDELRKDIYRKFSQQRLAFANELNMIIQRHGGSPERDTTMKGKLYRQWMDFKAALTGRDEDSILGSNIYGEEWAQKAYRDALDHELPYDVRGIILRQREASSEVLQRLHQMRSGNPASADSSYLNDQYERHSSNGSSHGLTPLKTALYAAGAAAGAALVYGLLTKRIPTDKLMAGITSLTKNVDLSGLTKKGGNNGTSGSTASASTNSSDAAGKSAGNSTKASGSSAKKGTKA
ncbi:PA2169 family four-helix-bundle protein [Nibribacter ruber]|uniref:PA2169 family four-helix-bundle protein n=1 Tax=Nibribacter ruber TaxID=2698458 RepID=A0A6P1P3U9_9BACT|nr:PA2169 family four-helix-bundle protein [Nibribacter ruber]QHL89109.1 PA2169 family four-helix-bundle protein [Nibribacter ruber]